jgi:oligopeptide/dipeptide ABC transporter ATP-binding protein
VTDPASRFSAGPLLEARNVSVTYQARSRRGPAIHAVSQVALQLARGEVLGLVGESGCGKSSLARALVGLEPATGEIILEGQPLPPHRTREQARRVQIVFQDPYASLNPRMTVRHAVEEMLRVHRLRPSAKVAARASELLHLVGLPPRAFDARPAALSGGQRQRVAIARALALEPEVLVADEPTTALDVSVQAVILELFARLRDDLGLALLLITHNLAVVSAMCDRIAVMYLGRIIEQAPARVLLADPRHPYTRRLLAAVPRLEPGQAPRQAALRGDPPGLAQIPSGCVFHPRCPQATAHCTAVAPTLATGSEGPNGDAISAHRAACHYAWQPAPAGSSCPPAEIRRPPAAPRGYDHRDPSR